MSPRTNSNSARRRLLVATQIIVAAAVSGLIAAKNPNDNTSARPPIAPPVAPATIETDGTLDTSFDAGNFTNGQVLCSVLQPDGKLLIGGQFTKVHTDKLSSGWPD